MKEISKELQKITDSLPVQAPTESQPLRTSELGMALKSPKIAQISDEELRQVLRYLLVLVGIRANNVPVNEEKSVLLEFVRENYGMHTVEEIKLAFKMAVSGRLSVDPNCYENFSCTYFGKIMAAYRDWAKNEVKYVQPDKELPMLNPPAADWSEFWQDCIKAVVDGKISTKIIPVPVYEWLKEKNILDLSVEERKELFERSKKAYRSELTTLAQLNGLKGQQIIEYDILKNGLSLPDEMHLKISNRAKVQAVRDCAEKISKKSS